MERRVHELLLLLVAALLLVACVSSLKDDDTKARKSGETETSQFSRRGMIDRQDKRRSLVTNPVTTPSTYTPDVSPPSIVNFPSTSPIIEPPNPTTPSTGVTNPVTTPSTNPGMQPVTNPGSSGGLPGTGPVSPPLATNDPAVPGQSWCVAKSGSLQIALQSALDYACNIGGVDCSAIQEGASCYNPNSLEFHASYAFNSYYLKNPDQSSCDFGGTAMITNANPSSGSCIFPTASSSTSLPSPVAQNPTNTSTTPINPTVTPVIQNPTNASPTPINPTPTPGEAGTPPFTLNSSTPDASGIPGVPVTGPASRLPVNDFPDSPPGASTSISMSSSLQPFISEFTLVIFIITGKHIMDF